MLASIDSSFYPGTLYSISGLVLCPRTYWNRKLNGGKVRVGAKGKFQDVKWISELQTLKNAGTNRRVILVTRDLKYRRNEVRAKQLTTFTEKT